MHGVVYRLTGAAEGLCQARRGHLFCLYSVQWVCRASFRLSAMSPANVILACLLTWAARMGMGLGIAMLPPARAAVLCVTGGTVPGYV